MRSQILARQPTALVGKKSKSFYDIIIRQNRYLFGVFASIFKHLCSKRVKLFCRGCEVQAVRIATLYGMFLQDLKMKYANGQFRFYVSTIQNSMFESKFVVVFNDSTTID